MRRLVIQFIVMTLAFILTHSSLAKTSPDYQELQTAINAAAKEQLVPGALLLIQTPDASSTLTYGYSNIHSKTAPDLKQSLRVGSVTKSMTSAVIIQLAQENKLNLLDPVSKYIPGVPNGDHITLALLMQNRSGLYNYLEDPELSTQFDKNPLKVWEPSQLLQIAFKHPNNFAPDEKFEYCNTGFILLGLIAEKIEKKPLYQIFYLRLFKPLKMDHTYLPHGSGQNLPRPYAHGYGYGGAAHVMYEQPYSAEDKIHAGSGTLKLKDYTLQNASWGWAAGGAVSTPQDLAIWIKALATGKLFNEKFYQEWLHAFVPIDNKNIVSYSYGAVKISTDKAPPVYFHNGQVPGYNTYTMYFPAKDTTVVIWSNLGTNMECEPPSDKMMEIVYELVFAK